MRTDDHSSAPAFTLAGTYKLVSATSKVLDTGETYDTSGKQPGGYINYTSDGRMSVLMVADRNERPAPESGAAISDQQAAALFRTMVAYGGAYEFDGRTVKHHIDISWNETWTGTTQIRDVRKDGDQLVFTTPPFASPFDGKMNVATVVWQKVDRSAAPAAAGNEA